MRQGNVMIAGRALQSALYRHRYYAKQALGLANRVLPRRTGRWLRGLAEQVAFRVVPQYQGDTLPPIFHYWSGRYVAPLLARIGIGRPEDLFFIETERHARKTGRPISVVSLGTGSCSLEVSLAAALRERGIQATLECVDINASLIQQATTNARALGLTDCMSFKVADCTHYARPAPADVIIVNQFLHHVEDLEAFCASLAHMLAPDGLLLTADMVGRNGHLPWPAVDSVVQSHWKALSPAQQFDRFYNARRTHYAAVDHASYSNEGVRAQDIVHCLSNSFDFTTFLTFGGAIMPFVERRVGFNFDPQDAADRTFIDEVAERDQTALLNAEYPGSNMIAVLRHKGCAQPGAFHPVTPAEHIRMTADQLSLAAKRLS